MGKRPIIQIVQFFYQRIFNDHDEPWFRAPFVRISGIEHHIATQVAFWIDAFGGGHAYHGGDARLNFHHERNAVTIMNARGAKRWMHHMTATLLELNFDHIDKRVMPCIVDFIRTKMIKYAEHHEWKFDDSDFSALIERYSGQ